MLLVLKILRFLQWSLFMAAHCIGLYQCSRAVYMKHIPLRALCLAPLRFTKSGYGVVASARLTSKLHFHRFFCGSHHHLSPPQKKTTTAWQQHDKQSFAHASIRPDTSVSIEPSMRISYTEHVTNDEFLCRVGQDRALLGQVKSRRLKYFGHTTRHNSLEKDIMLGTMPGTRRQGGQRNNG